jgi:hypothetical protein
MNRLTLTAAGLIALTAATAFALPPVPKYAADYYAKDPNAGMITEGLKANKCNLCHIPGADKKAKGHALQDFGKAVHDNFKHKDFTAEHNKSIDEKLPQADRDAAKAKAMEILVDALQKAAQVKNADGKAFGDLIKAGMMPGKNPEK